MYMCLYMYVYIYAYVHVHPRICIYPTFWKILILHLITYLSPLLIATLYCTFYIPSSIIDLKGKKIKSVEKLKKYFAFVDLTFKCVPFRSWESIQQLHKNTSLSKCQ